MLLYKAGLVVSGFLPFGLGEVLEAERQFFQLTLARPQRHGHITIRPQRDPGVCPLPSPWRPHTSVTATI